VETSAEARRRDDLRRVARQVGAGSGRQVDARTVTSLCAKERVAVAAGNAPEGVPGATGIRSPDAPPVLAEPISVASGSGAVVLTECSIVTCRRCSIACATRLRVALLCCATGRSDAAAGDAPEGVSDVLGVPALRQQLRVGLPLRQCFRAARGACAICSRRCSTSAAGMVPRLLIFCAPSALADAQRPLREWFLGCSSSARHLLSQMLNVRCGNGSSVAHLLRSLMDGSCSVVAPGSVRSMVLAAHPNETGGGGVGLGTRREA
jgi:hypothetical protein